MEKIIKVKRYYWKKNNLNANSRERRKLSFLKKKFLLEYI